MGADQTIVSVVDRNGISDTYETIATGKYSEIPLVSDWVESSTVSGQLSGGRYE